MSLFFSHTVFSFAADNFVKSMSSREWSDLVAAPGLLDAQHCRPYHIVVKRSKRFFWNRVKLFPTAFKLLDILEDDCNNDKDEKDGFSGVNLTSTELVSFDRSIAFEAKGKFGASLAREIVGVDLEAGRSATVSVNLGKVNEHSLDIPELIDVLQNKKIDMGTDFMQEVMSNERNTLCIVVTSLNAESGSDLNTEVKFEGLTEVDINAGTDNSVTLGSELVNDRRRNLHIPANTPVAFRMMEVLVKSDRSIQLMVLPDSEGGFEKKPKENLKAKGVSDVTPHPITQDDHTMDYEGRALELSEIRQQLKPFFAMSRDALTQLRTCLIELLPEQRTLDTLSILFQTASNMLVIGQGGKRMSRESFIQKIGSRGFGASKILQAAGFSFENDDVIYPGPEVEDILTCLSGVLDLMALLNEDEGRTLHDCTDTEKVLLMRVLVESLKGEYMSLDQPLLTDLFTMSERAESLVFGLGFQLERKYAKWQMSWKRHKVEDDITPQEMLVLMCGLWDNAFETE